MGRDREVIRAFLTAYVKNDRDVLARTLDENVELNYSTIGVHHGREAALRALAWQEDYNVHTVTVTNQLPYSDGERDVVGLIAHHLIGNERGSELFPLVFGGKYVFTLCRKTGRLLRICYAQEYQAENTLYIRHWRLAGHEGAYSAIEDFDPRRALAGLEDAPLAEQAAAVCKAFFWAADTGNTELVRALADPEIHALRYKTMSYGSFESSGADALSDFFAQCRAYYAMDQYSFAIRGVEEREDSVVLTASHLIPHRTGTKKLNVNTKYHSFFDEDITVSMKRTPQGLRILDVTMKKIADVHYNGFELLELN